MKKIIIFLSLLVCACSQADQPTETAVNKQSAVEVKSQTQTLHLKPLSTANQSSFTQSTLQHDIQPNLIQPNLRNAAALFAAKISDVQVEDTGVIIKILADDTLGSRHQKFLVKIANGQTLLFAHNIDLAARIANIKVGDNITFRGEYEYNPKGGIVHWTHQDPQGTHFAGWIKHNGQVYD